MNKFPFLICLLSAITFFSPDAYSRMGDRGSVYGIANLDVAQNNITLTETDTENGATISTSSAKKTKEYPAIEIGAGYYLFDSFRTDLSIYYSSASYKFTSGTVIANGVTTTGTITPPISIKNKTMGVLWGVSYELFSSAKFSPFITVGAGYLRDEAKDQNTIKAKKNSYVAYLLGLGVAYSVDSGIDILVGYKYIGNKNAKLTYTDTTTDATTGLVETETRVLKKKPTNALQIGAKFKF